MQLTKEYIAEQDDCVRRNVDGYKKYMKDVCTYTRLHIIQEFIKGKEKILSVGSGAHEPVFMKTTHAIDVPAISGELLKQQGWPGEFKQGSCDELPYGDKEFDAAICSEVLEHLPNFEVVRKTILEVDRVAKSWIITTPNVDKCPRHLQDKSHVQFWNEQQIRELLPEQLRDVVEISKLSIFIFIKKWAAALQ